MFSTQLFQSENIYLEAYDPEKDAKIESGFTHNLNYAWALDTDEAAHPLTAFEIKKKREEQLKKAEESGQAFFFAIRAKSDERFLGVIAFPWVMWNNGEGIFRIMVGDPECQEKYLAEVLNLTLRYAFEELHLYYLSTSSGEFQPEIMQALLDAELKIAVRQRQMDFRDGKYWDRLLFGISQEAWTDLQGED